MVYFFVLTLIDSEASGPNLSRASSNIRIVEESAPPTGGEGAVPIGWSHGIWRHCFPAATGQADNTIRTSIVQKVAGVSPMVAVKPSTESIGAACGTMELIILNCAALVTLRLAPCGPVPTKVRVVVAFGLNTKMPSLPGFRVVSLAAFTEVAGS